MWGIEFTGEFDVWWDTLPEAEQEALAESETLLERLRPPLPRPHADAVKGSRHHHMRELRMQCQGRPIRTLFAFDPRRTAILLIGGDKTGDDRFHEQMIPRADDLYDQHLRQLHDEGLI